MLPLKSSLQRIPFIRISGLFILGILVNHYFKVDDLWTGSLLFLVISILILLWHNKHFKAIKLQNLLISLALFLLGIFYPFKGSDKPLLITNKSSCYIAELCNKPSKKANSYQSVLLIKSKIQSVHKKVLVYFSKEAYDTTLTAGDQLIIQGRLQEIRTKVNPYDFDYKTLMRNKGIFYSIYLSPQGYQKTGIQSNKVNYIAERIRDKLTGILYKTKLKPDERALVSALTLGYRSELDRETMNSFADTGTIHVLSVSGLHVALIFYILTLFLSPFKRGKITGFVYPLLIIISLWCYAFITGFSPSVQRSTVMFSFVIIGSILCRPVNIYNSLMASGLLLVLMDPNVLFDIGFQLSYLAIFGIVLLQPPLDNLLLVKNKILKWMWTLFTVSIAAQLITFPLSIFYFNQFPNIFWLSNFIAIPGTTIILWLTFIFFIFSPLAFISNILAGIIQFLTHTMLVSLKWISQLPHAVNEGIIYSPFQMLLIYGLLFSFIIYGFSKTKSWFFYSLILLILFQTASLLNKFNLFNQKTVYQYHTKNSMIHCINGRNNYIIRVDNQPFDEQEIQLIQNVCYHLKLNQPRIILLNERKLLSYNDIVVKNNVLYFLNCHILINDQLTFHIKERDVYRFIKDNPKLLPKTNIIYPRYQPELLVQKTPFSIDFKIQRNEAVCIFINNYQ